jgi:hypothetical protein
MPREKKIHRPNYRTNHWMATIECQFRNIDGVIITETINVKVDKHIFLGFDKMHLHDDVVKLISDTVEDYSVEHGFVETVKYVDTQWSPDQDELFYDDEGKIIKSLPLERGLRR